jgi:hypothetical protein
MGFSISFDESKKGGIRWLVMTLRCIINGVGYTTVIRMCKLGAVTDKAIGIKWGATKAMAYALTMYYFFQTIGLLFRIDGEYFCSLDSCVTNTDCHGGVIAFLVRFLKVRIHMVHCQCHILHNALHTAITKGPHPWKPDPTKKRQGCNRLVFFFLEKMSELVHNNFSQVAPNQEFCKPEKATQTRWFAYGRVATWLVDINQFLLTAQIAKTVAKTHSEMSASWKQLMEWLFNKELMLQVAIIAEFGQQFLEYAFL